MDKKQERRGLGRGLSALMADVNLDAAQKDEARPRRDQMMPIEKLFANPQQPRRDFPEAALEELTASIREKGVIQPLIVRERPAETGTYEIVAGERRWRAAQRAQLHEVPVLVRTLTDNEVLEIAIIENIQRADLNPVEEAMGYRQLMDRFGHTQERVAEALSKSRSHIANLLRLLTLPAEVLAWLREGKLTSGHARALITTTDPVGLARQVMTKGLSVRETEALARMVPGPKGPKAVRPTRKDADTTALEQDLSTNLGMKVSINHRPGAAGGTLTIKYGTLEALDDLCRVLSTGALAGTI